MHPDDPVLFSRPYRAPATARNLMDVLESDHAHGDGLFTARASERLSPLVGGGRVLLTTSGTDALEMAARLIELGPGDEVVLPSFTFPSGATSIALTGATCVFVDLDPETGNVDPAAVGAAVTSRTKAVSVMHYGGVAVDMDAIGAIAREHSLAVIEDNAHGLGGSFGGRALGSIGDRGAQRVHDTKTVHSGEGGALVVNDPTLVERAEIIREKGTNRSKFLRGQVDKYTWVDLGSSYLMSDVNAAILDAQLQVFVDIQRLRHGVWNAYRAELGDWAEGRGWRLMAPRDASGHTAHLFWMLAPDHAAQQALLHHLRGAGVMATFHYQPLHASPAGERFGRAHGDLRRTVDFAERLVRLPLWPDLSSAQVSRVIDAVRAFPGA